MSRNAGGKKAEVKRALTKPKSHFPMTVKHFFAEADIHLRYGDILLSRSPTYASRIIRFVSRQFFSHAAVIFLLPRHRDRFFHTFVIESLFKGVGIANLESYVGGPMPIEEVGILRLQGKAFTKDFFKFSNGTLLNEVNKPYDFKRLWQLAFSSVFGFQRAVQQLGRKPNRFRRWFPRQFICSGFIQYGFFQAAVSEKINTQDVILKTGLDYPSTDEMMGTTPEDLARSDKLTWKFVIRRGWVYEVANYSDAKRIISGARL